MYISFFLCWVANAKPHFQWNIGCVGSLALGLCIGHVHLIFFGLKALQKLRKRPVWTRSSAQTTGPLFLKLSDNAIPRCRVRPLFIGLGRPYTARRGSILGSAYWSPGSGRGGGVFITWASPTWCLTRTWNVIKAERNWKLSFLAHRSVYHFYIFLLIKVFKQPTPKQLFVLVWTVKTTLWPFPYKYSEWLSYKSPHNSFLFITFIDQKRLLNFRRNYKW